MQRNKDELNRRAAWVQTNMNNRNGITVEEMVNRLAKKIFVSPATIWKDVKKNVPALASYYVKPASYSQKEKQK